MTKRTKNLGLIVPTVEDDAAIAAGIAQDPETIVLTAADMAAMKPLRRMGRSPVERSKVSLTVRVDADLLEAIKKIAPG